jgi:flagellar protein FlaI
MFDPLPFNAPAGARLVETYPVEYELEGFRIAYLVYLLEGEGRGYYYVREPPVSAQALEALRRLVERAHLHPRRKELLEAPIRTLLGLLGREEMGLAYYIARDIVGYGPLEPFLRDPEVEDLSCEGYGRPLRVWHRRFNAHEWLTSNLVFERQEQLDALVAKMAFRAGRPLSAFAPLLDASLPEGYRVSATWGRDISPAGSSFTIRKFRERPYTITELISLGALDHLLAAYLWLLIELKGFLIIAGPTASGKTTLLNALATLLHPNWKVLTIEDTRELLLPQEGWKALTTRPSPLEKASVDVERLVYQALRERPDYIILGETRGREASLLFQSAALGHGVMTTFHASTPEGLLARMASPPLSVQPELLKQIDAAVFVARAREGEKVVRRVYRVGGFVGGEWRSLCAWNGRFWEQQPYAMAKLEELGARAGLGAREVEAMLERRAAFLEALLGAKKYGYQAIARELRWFYLRELSASSRS